MKYFFSLLFIFLCTQQSFSKELETQYDIKTKGITIGSLSWTLTIKNNLYTTSISLKNKGIFSSLYAFEGKYNVSGKLIDNVFYTEEYNQYWKTKKKERLVKIIFKNKKINNIKILPKEKEHPRIKYKNLKNFNDPITSFLNIIFNNISSNTIDGRRTYLLVPKINKNKIKISIKKYINIWADHKRNDLEYIEISSENSPYLPKQVDIMFKGSVFSLKEI